MIDFAAVRAAITEQVQAAMPTLNVYPYPEPQPVAPALVLPTLEAVAFHVTTACEGVTVELRAELVVADADLASAVANLESLVPLMVAIEAVESPALANVIVHGAGNFRVRDTGGLSCELVLTVHV